MMYLYLYMYIYTFTHAYSDSVSNFPLSCLVLTYFCLQRGMRFNKVSHLKVTLEAHLDLLLCAISGVILGPTIGHESNFYLAEQLLK